MSPACEDIKVQVVLQFGVCRGLREVFLSQYGRGYPSEIVSEFEPKPGPRGATARTRRGARIDVRAGTWAVLTYVRQDRWVADQASLDMDTKRCSHFLVREEGNHSREEGWYLLRGLESAMLSFDFRHLPTELIYDEHYRLAIFVRPSRCVEEECDAARNFLGPKERYPCRQPIHLSNWC